MKIDYLVQTQYRKDKEKRLKLQHDSMPELDLKDHLYKVPLRSLGYSEASPSAEFCFLAPSREEEIVYLALKKEREKLEDRIKSNDELVKKAFNKTFISKANARVFGLGLHAGFVAGAVGGYNLGSFINNYGDIHNLIGKAVVYTPCLALGIATGTLVGSCIAALIGTNIEELCLNRIKKLREE